MAAAFLGEPFPFLGGLPPDPATDLAPLMALGGSTYGATATNMQYVAGKTLCPRDEVVHNEILLRYVGIELEQIVVEIPRTIYDGKQYMLESVRGRSKALGDDFEN